MRHFRRYSRAGDVRTEPKYRKNKNPFHRRGVRSPVRRDNPRDICGRLSHGGQGALENAQGYNDGSLRDYRAEHERGDGNIMFSGKWRTDRDGVTSSGREDEAMHRYHARSVYAVLSVENPKKAGTHVSQARRHVVEVERSRC